MGLSADLRSSRPSPPAASAQAARTTALRPAKGPVSRSCPYGGWENPTAVSQPTKPRGIAASGSATKDSAVTTAALPISMAVGEIRPCSAAATVPSAKSIPKPVTRAKGAASPRCLELFISYPSQAPEASKANDLDRSLTPRSALLTRPLHLPETAALSVMTVIRAGRPGPGCGPGRTHDCGRRDPTAGRPVRQ